MSDQVAVRAADSSAGVGPSFAMLASSASIACSSSSGVWPGLAVAVIWNTEPSVSDCWLAWTSCAICRSKTRLL
ncbi:MAG: hypothetical protein A2V63_12260 [Candidatus Eisenbacteria bacterium RBG_19FT_COMBO_70_11]|nr:MAG: hypothetical protein A2V63_12260 [Candidatus Eisenbacteria bacterium RBG_19FT_COMBO_70_11]